MNYISVKEAAVKWGITVRRVQFLCAQKMIPGAVNMGKQWLIPEDAVKPSRRSMKNVPAESASPLPLPYFFPLFFYMLDLSSPETAGVPEALLRSAVQILQGNFCQEVPVLRNIKNNDPDPNVRFSATALLAYSLLFLGVADQFTDCVTSMRAMTEAEQEHHEDYRLCCAFMNHFRAYDPACYASFDFLKLSEDGLTFYSLALLASDSFAARKQTLPSIATYELLCRNLEAGKAAFGSMSLHCLIGLYYHWEKDNDHAEFHVKEACITALKNDLLFSLAFLYPTMPAVFNKYLVWKGHNYVMKVRTMSDEICHGCALLHADFEIDKDMVKTALMEGNQILHFLVFGLTNREIGQVLELSSGVVQRKIQDLIEKTGVKDRAALCRFAKDLYAGRKVSTDAAGRPDPQPES